MPSMQERRGEARSMCADMVEITWLDRSGRNRTATALLEDISPSGACLQVEASIPKGTAIQWRLANQPLVGVVRYCVFREIGYFLGIQFEAGTTWSKETYRPQHMLELENLMLDACSPEEPGDENGGAG